MGMRAGTRSISRTPSDCVQPAQRRFVCNSIEAASTFAGSVGGFIAGGGGGALLAVATGGTATPAVPIAAFAGAAAGSAAGLAAGRALTDRFFSEAADGPAGGGRSSGLREQLADHEKKLADYIRNPDANDNLGFLQNATSEAQRQRIIQGRIRNLENQINNFKKQIEQAERSP